MANKFEIFKVIFTGPRAEKKPQDASIPSGHVSMQDRFVAEHKKQVFAWRYVLGLFSTAILIVTGGYLSTQRAGTIFTPTEETAADTESLFANIEVAGSGLSITETRTFVARQVLTNYRLALMPGKYEIESAAIQRVERGPSTPIEAVIEGDEKKPAILVKDLAVMPGARTTLVISYRVLDAVRDDKDGSSSIFYPVAGRIKGGAGLIGGAITLSNEYLAVPDGYLKAQLEHKFIQKDEPFAWEFWSKTKPAARLADKKVVALTGFFTAPYGTTPPRLRFNIDEQYMGPDESLVMRISFPSGVISKKSAVGGESAGAGAGNPGNAGSAGTQVAGG